MRRLILLAALLAAAPALADPYTLSRGSTTVTLLGSVWSIDTFFDGDGKRKELPFTITQTDLVLSMEHGLTDRLTLAATLPYSRSERDSIAGDPAAIEVNDGASDLRMGLKWRLSGEGSTQYGLLVGVKWPGDYEPDVINTPGDGNFDAELLVTLGQQIGHLTLALDAGYRHRNGNPDDELIARFQPSYLVASRLTLFGALDWVDSQGGIPIDEVGPDRPFSSVEEDYLRVSLGVFYSFSQRLGAFAAWNTSVDGRSTARGSQWTLGTRVSF